MRHLATMVLALALLGGCGGDDDTTDEASTPATGEGLYQEHCASCHGTDLRGTDDGPSHLSVVYEPGHHPDAAFRSAITNGAPAHHWGFGDMPPVEGLGEDEVEAIISYVREQQGEHGFEPYPPES